MRRCAEAYQTSAAAVLAAGLWLWTLVANVASDGIGARRCRTLPLLNPLDIGIGIALAATLLWLRSGRPRSRAGRLGDGRLAVPASSG